ncbi:MAG: hypothetical protein ACM3W4_10550 [Ignavibacteriales bacterium]
MSDDTPANTPRLNDRGKAELEERKRRQAEALRANLQRRKLQSRARADQPAAPPADEEKA